MVVPGATPGPTSTLPGVSKAVALEAEEPEAGERVSVVPEIVAVALGRETRGCVGSTDREDAEDVWLMLTTPVPVAGL